jgi:hypothetical protein
MCKKTTQNNAKSQFNILTLHCRHCGDVLCYLLWQACPINLFIISNRQKLFRLQNICPKLIEISILADREPPVTLRPVTVVMVSTVRSHCYYIYVYIYIYIYFHIAPSEPADLIIVIVGSYRCPCELQGDI